MYLWSVFTYSLQPLRPLPQSRFSTVQLWLALQQLPMLSGLCFSHLAAACKDSNSRYRPLSSSMMTFFFGAPALSERSGRYFFKFFQPLAARFRERWDIYSSHFLPLLKGVRPLTKRPVRRFLPTGAGIFNSQLIASPSYTSSSSSTAETSVS